jgi:predicted phage terminase large subunit-like protein
MSGCACTIEEIEDYYDGKEFELPSLADIEAEICRRSLSEFIRSAWHVFNQMPLEWGPHIETMCWHIQQQLEDSLRARRGGAPVRTQNLIINIPPRSLKTTVLVCANAWIWLHEPSLHIMYLSANPRVATNSARTFRDLINSQWYQSLGVSWKFRGDQDALTDMGNTAGGKRMARGLDSTIIGEGADWICIDDPHDMRDTVTQVLNTCEGYDSAVANRLNQPSSGIRTCIMQRVMIGDFTDRVLKLGDWLHLRLPMLFEVNAKCECGTCHGTNIYGWQDWRKKEGEVLHPRYTKAFLDAELKRLGPMGYAGQMQQRPAPREGNLFKLAHWEWFSLDGDTTPRKRPEGARLSPSYPIKRRKDGSLELDWVCVSMDPTGGAQHENASAVGLTIISGQGLRRFVLEDMDVGPRGPSEQIEDVKRAVVRAGMLAGSQRAFRVLIEKKALGVGVFEQIEKAVKQGELRYPDGTPIIAEVMYYEPSGKGDKKARADHLEPDLLAGLIYLLDGAPWVGDYVQEFGLFPSGSARDDRVDALAQCLDVYRPANTDTQWTTAAKKFGLMR